MWSFNLVFKLSKSALLEFFPRKGKPHCKILNVLLYWWSHGSLSFSLMKFALMESQFAIHEPFLSNVDGTKMAVMKTLFQMAFEDDTQRTGSGRVPRGRGCNESFRAAVDRSYDAPIAGANRQMETRKLGFHVLCLTSLWDPTQKDFKIRLIMHSVCVKII